MSMSPEARVGKEAVNIQADGKSSSGVTLESLAKSRKRHSRIKKSGGCASLGQA
jgi:hypothetical protein